MSDSGTIGADPCAYRPGTDCDWRPAELDIGQQSFLVNSTSDGEAMWVTFGDVERIDEIDRTGDVVELEVLLADRRIIGLRVTPEMVDRMLASLTAASAAAEGAADASPASASVEPAAATAPEPSGPPPGAPLLPPMGIDPPGGRPPSDPDPPPPPTPDPVAPHAPAGGAVGPRPATVTADLTSAEPVRTDDDAPGNFTIAPRAGSPPTPTPMPTTTAAPEPTPPLRPAEALDDERRLRRPLALAALAAVLLAAVVVLIVQLVGGDDDTVPPEDPVATTAPTTEPPGTAPAATEPPPTAPEPFADLSVTVTQTRSTDQDGERAIYVDLELRNDADEDVSSFQTVIDIAVDDEGDSVMAAFPMTCDTPLPAGEERSGVYTGDVEADAASFADCTVAGWTVDLEDPTQVAVAQAITGGADAQATARILSVRAADGSELEP